MSPAVAIPFHGWVQLVANGWRVFLFRRHIGWHLVGRFSLLLPFGVAVGLWLFQALPKESIQVLIGCVVLFSLFARHIRQFRGKELPLGAFVPLGGLAGKSLLNWFNERIFMIVFQVVLVLLALKLIVWEGIVKAL